MPIGVFDTNTNKVVREFEFGGFKIYGRTLGTNGPQNSSRVSNIKILGVLPTAMADVNVKKKTFRLLALLSVIFALQGCATVQGIGEDIQSLGRAMKRAVSGITRNKLTGG